MILPNIGSHDLAAAVIMTPSTTCELPVRVEPQPQPGARRPDPTPEFLAEASRALETASPREIIGWTVENYFPRLTMATAFGPEGCVILHFLAQVEPRVHVFNLDTGYQF